MPVLSTILGIAAVAASTAGSVGGVIEGAQAGGRQQKALTEQEQIAQQEMADKQKIYDQLSQFFTPYLSSGSPFLSQIQRASAEQTQKGANDAAGRIRESVGASGLGFGPSGATAAAIGEEGAQTNATASSNYLTNLLNNEQIKFQAAQGLNAAGTMAGSPQNQPNVSAQLPYQSLGSGLQGLSQIINGITGNSTPVASSKVGTLPTPPAGNIPAPFPVPGVNTGTTPTTEGWAF
jgi:hypothetical protein